MIDDTADPAAERARLAAALHLPDRGVLDAVLRHSPHGIIVCDREGRLIAQNPAATRIWAGAAQADSVAEWGQYRAFHDDGRPFAPEDWTMARSLRDRVVIAGVEFRILRFDGTPAWLLGSSAPLLDDRGELLGAISIFADITDVKDAERALSASERRYRQILDSVQEMVFTKDHNLTVVYANAATCRYYGMTAEQLRGLTDVPFNERDFTDQYLRDDLRVLETGETVEVLGEPNVSPAGETRWFHTIKTPIRDERGEVREIVGVSRDVTERRRIEQRLRAAHAVAEILADAPSKQVAMPRVLEALGAAFDCDVADYWRVAPERDGLEVLTTWSRTEADRAVWRDASVATAIARGVGLPGRAWATGRAAYLDDVGADPSFPRRAAAAALGLRSGLAFPVILAGDVLGVISLFSRAVQPHDAAHLDALGAIGNHVAQFVQRVRIQEALRRQLATRDLMARASELFASTLDVESVLRDLARVVVPLLGDWCAIDVVDDAGVQRRLVTHHVDPAKVSLAAELERRFPADPNATSGVPHVLRTGRTDYLREITEEMLAALSRGPEHLDTIRALGLRSYVVVPIRTRDRVAGALTLVTAESGRLFDDGDVAVAEELARRAALSFENALLYRAAEERARALERSNQELDQFAYVTSHDLKAPLRGIANLAQWIEEDLGDGVPESVTKHLALLRGRVKRMDGLIQGILDLSRAGRARAAPEPVDLARMVEEVVELLHPVAPARVTIAGPLPTIVAERAALQQVLLNLIGNALKHAGRPDAEVEVRAADRGAEVELAIADNGPGIAPEYHERVWGIFQTLEARDRVESTGIGLAIVRKVVQARGGRAWIEPSPGRGATFCFTWPKDEPRT